MAAIVVVLVIAGCSKKPSEYETEVNYSPSSVTAFPDTSKITIKWAINSEAEAQDFGGYYIYCTDRALTASGGSDSIIGLAQLPAESLQYWQVPGCPFPKGADSVVLSGVGYDSTRIVKFTRGKKYYFYARTMVAGQLSWAANWVRSSPRLERNDSIYAFVPAMVAADTLASAPKVKGLYSVFSYKHALSADPLSPPSLSPALYKVPLSTWRDTLIDSTASSITFTYTPASHDSVLCGYWPDTVLPVKRAIVWIDPANTTLGKKIIKLNTRKYKSAATKVEPVTIADLVAKYDSPTGTVELQSPSANDAIPDSLGWQADGLSTSIQELSGGWSVSVPNDLITDAPPAIATPGKIYQLVMSRVSGTLYAKIRIDDVVTDPTSGIVKVRFHTAFQLVPGFKSF